MSGLVLGEFFYFYSCSLSLVSLISRLLRAGEKPGAMVFLGLFVGPARFCFAAVYA